MKFEPLVVEMGVTAKLFFAFLDTWEEVGKSHKVSAKLNKGIKSYSALKIRGKIWPPFLVVIGLTESDEFWARTSML